MATPENVKREWLLVDAEGQPVGRVAARVALILRGKHKPTYTPHTDAGDYVIIVNSDKAIFTGKKMERKYYFRHTGFIGGDKFVQAKEMMAKNSDRAMEHAVKGMLPKSPLGRVMFTKLKVYKTAEHPHKAQQPRKIDLNGGAK
ncbi:MAG: 50S ribosomal protein L13 [Christensenellaceae bacterium]|nr:50S ribosomal protein L13 [Christensenellaceae bacterium]